MGEISRDFGSTNSILVEWSVSFIQTDTLNTVADPETSERGAKKHEM